MKLKNSYFYTLRENAKDEDSTSGNLLVRAGMIKKVSSGIYMYLPLGLKALDNIKKIIKEEETILPNENKVKYYQDKYEIFKKLYPALKVLYRKDNL